MRLPQIGQKFRDRYLVEEVLGEGAFGAVYAAMDTAMSRPVALKILKPDAGDAYDPKTKARFDREIKIVSNLRSSTTVSLFDCGATDDGLLFSVFEKVPGEDLSEHLLRVGRMPVGATVHVARQILMSLQEAHGQGLLHRDIKPQNIRLFHHNGDPLAVKVLDFGLARGMKGEGPAVTEEGEVIGTPRYMAPEQLMDAEITPASDVYSLGVLMLEMLLGSDAMHGTKFGDQLERLQAGHTFSVAGLEPSGLAPILMRMTARQPGDRFSNAGSVLRALELWEGQISTSSGTVTRPHPPPSTSSGVHSRPPPNHAAPDRRLVAVALAVVVLVAAVGAIAASLLFEPESPPIEPDEFRTRNPLGQVKQPELDPQPVVEVAVDAGLQVADLRPQTACGQQPPFHGEGHLASPGMFAQDRWLTYIPNTYDPQKQYPLVILLHPTGQTPKELFGHSRFGELAEEHDFVVIAPTRSRLMMSWLDTEAAQDVDLIKRIYESTAERLCIDERRVFIAAQGHGAYPAYRAGCEDWVTGIATNAFRMTANMRFCSDTKTRPYMLMSPNNGHDPWDGGMTCAQRPVMSVVDVEELWATRNGCSGDRKRTFRHKGSTCYTYDCETPFVSCHINGGHNWPGSPQRHTDWVNCDNEPPDFPMAQRMWEFFDSLEPLPP